MKGDIKLYSSSFSVANFPVSFRLVKIILQAHASGVRRQSSVPFRFCWTGIFCKAESELLSVADRAEIPRLNQVYPTQTVPIYTSVTRRE